jgi:hypothetical protein
MSNHHLFVPLGERRLPVRHRADSPRRTCCRRQPADDIPGRCNNASPQNDRRDFRQAAENDRLAACSPRHVAGLLSRYRIRMSFHSVVRDDGYRLHPQSPAIDRQPARLRDKLPDRNDRAQNAHRVNRSFQQVPTCFLRTNQQCLGSLTVHRPLFLSSKDAAHVRLSKTTKH